MPTILSHPAAVLALAPWFRPHRALLITGALFTVIPDADVVAFAAGIPYGHPLGHRGLSHSIPVAAVAAAGAAYAMRHTTSPASTWCFLFACMASHGLLDAATNGGLGVGFLLPFSARRFFLPWRPIPVSPIGLTGFLQRGWPVLAAELLLIWLPAGVLAAAGWRRKRLDPKR